MAGCTVTPVTPSSSQSSAQTTSSSNAGETTQSSQDPSIPQTTTSESNTSAEQPSSSQSASQQTSQSTSQSQSQATSSATSQPSGEAGFSNITEFKNPVEIHTAAQKTYLSYEGDYSTIAEDAYPDGKSNISDSNPVALSWDYNAPSGKSVSKYSVFFGQKQDLSDGYEVQTTSKSANLYNPYLGINYFKIVANLNDSSKEETDVKTFTVDPVAPRNLTIGGMTNCRDMGGRITEDGGEIKQGLVYRTSGYKYDYSTTITEDGKKEMLEHLKVKTEVNVADGQNYNLKLSGTNVVNLFMDYDSSGSNSTHHFSRNAENVKNFFKLLADTSNYPVYFHCRIGTDRTGLCANLLYGLLGVPLNEIYQDYLFSNFGKIGEKRYIGAKAGQDNIQKYIDQINSFPGKTFKNKVYNVLLSIGVSAETLNAVINNLTDGPKAKDNDAGQVIGLADQFVAQGTSKKTDSDMRNNPDSYYTLNSNSQSVSYTFNASAAYKGTIVAYLGNTEHSSTKKIGDAISCSLDDAAVAIPDITYTDAGMGKCGQRMNYFPVILGTADIAAGQHTVKITGTSNTMNIASICVFNSEGSSQGGGQQGGEHTTHSYQPETPQTNTAGKSVTTYLCDCGAKYMAINFNDYSSMEAGTSANMSVGKLGKNSVFKWDFPAKAGRVTLQFNIKVSSSDHVSNASAVFKTSQYVIKANGDAQTITIADNTQYGTLGLSTSGQYFDFCTFDIDADKNVEIELDHNVTDYRLLFTEQVRLVYA